MQTPTDYRQDTDHLSDTCPVKAAIDVIRGRWKPSILCEIQSGAKRFSEMQVAIPEISPQILTVQLRQLQADGVLIRTVHTGIPLRVEYALSAHGRELSAVMEELEVWGKGYLQRKLTGSLVQS